ncbi:MAG: PHB depolymerase family esterase [Verrucomicrobiota bacterium]|nr:PHB depolymerase family esterase [Verrucomicrobiota bacterium]
MLKPSLILILCFNVVFSARGADENAKWKNTRNYKILKPKNYDPKKKYPLILSLHGFTSNGRGQAGFFPLADLAEKYGFLYCFPSGLDRSWNATNACCDWTNKNDDSTYLRNLILWAQKEYSIDRKKVYVTGLSNGGFMSYRMAQDHADLITAIAPFAGVGYKKWPKQPSGPVSVLHIHGTKDSTIKWKGGSIGLRAYPSAEQNFENWRKFNKCEKEIDASKEKIDLARKVSGKETSVKRFTNKDGNVTTELWQVTGGGHVTPPSKEARERIVKWLLARSK